MKSSPDSIIAGALADLWQRDIAELQRTNQPGGKSVIRKLKSAVREIRANGKGNSK